MKKTFLLIWIMILILLMMSCVFDDDDELFFYTHEVVGNNETGTNTSATWSYRSDGFVIIMTRWDDIWLSNKALTENEAQVLKNKTTFSLTFTPNIIPTQIDTKSVEKFHNGFEVTQRFYVAIPKGTYTLVGETTDSGKPDVRTDTITLTVN